MYLWVGGSWVAMWAGVNVTALFGHIKYWGLSSFGAARYFCMGQFTFLGHVRGTSGTACRCHCGDLPFFSFLGTHSGQCL